MITVDDKIRAALSSSFSYQVQAESWLGDQLLSDNIPIISGSETVDLTIKVPEKISFNVPRVVQGVNWSPSEVDHPLASNGQRLRVSLGIGMPDGITHWLQRGWYVVGESAPDGDNVTVTAYGLLKLVDEARLVSPYQPSGTLVSTLRGLLEPALTVYVDPALTDRSVPSGINFDEDRLQAVLDLLDAWPAEGRVTEDGYFYVSPPVSVSTSSTPDLVLAATVADVVGSNTRDGAFNCVVARGTAPDGGQVQGVANVTKGPFTLGGNFNPLPVPYFFESPLLTTVAQCNASARTVRDRLLRTAAKKMTGTIVPDPTLQGGEVLQVTGGDLVNSICTLTGFTLPYQGEYESIEIMVV